MSKPEVLLVSYSQMTGQSKTVTEQIAYCARVSNPTNQEIFNLERDEKLIDYLVRNHHWSPFEMVSICMEITTTRDIARQILRHRSFSFQEFSQRYALYDYITNPFVVRDARMQDTKNRQNSIDISDLEKEDIKTATRIQRWEDEQRQVGRIAIDAYKWAIENGIAKEQARAVLPEGMTLSKMYMNGTLRSWIHYIQLRTGNGTQREHQKVALECANQISSVFPMIHAFIE